MGTDEDSADPLEYLWKEGPFRGKKLVGTTKLVRQNIFFSLEYT